MLSSDFQFTGRYYRNAKRDLPIYVIAPPGSIFGGGLIRIDTLRAGETYPIMVTDIIDGGSGYKYARFKVSDDITAPYAGANYTMIPFYESESEALQQPYVKPPASPTVTNTVFSGILKVVTILGIAYVAGESFKSSPKS